MIKNKKKQQWWYNKISKIEIKLKVKDLKKLKDYIKKEKESNMKKID